ncbi:hypothetical protein [Marinobacter sp. P4B1]|uniref:hypothetical protein n=1 Tax=Marinobacter sp. P4B1 TaxID=1119533 RepID=UPI00071DD3AC|nr:hypothetical protein [Marinobacter sp. P4B1]KRW83706.1 hypothetical protein AQ621_16790 [Marinobacter sp. P4B1]
MCEKQFALRRPCANCPFRNDDQAIELMPGRREQIIQDLLTGAAGTFHCHRTVYRSDSRNHDEEGNYRPVDVCHCPGAAAMTQKVGGRDMTLVQIAKRLRMIGLDHYDDALPLTIEPDELDLDLINTRY